MKRRSVLQSIVGVPAAAAAMPAQTPVPSVGDQFPRLATVGVETVADSPRRFFTTEQFAALRRLADAIAPAAGGRPSANEAGVPEFLDFLIRESPAPVQKLYRDGLDRLHSESGRPIDETLAPLRTPWTYAGPSDPFARFLEQAKSDILQAAANSREWAESASRGRRGAGGMSNYYWRVLD